jgi:hypothetical protein
LKASSATSAKATADPRTTDRSSAKRPPSRTSAESFALTGASDPPDPQYNAFRKDLADVALAGQVLASHYAEPVQRSVTAETELRSGASADADVIGSLRGGDRFLAVEDSVGWAWGYAGDNRRVGYVRSDLLS